MPTQDLLFDLDDDGVATLTLNRPDRLNAFSGAMGQALADAYLRCDEDDDVRAVVLTGAGRGFCAGADMSDAAATFDLSGANLDDLTRIRWVHRVAIWHPLGLHLPPYRLTHDRDYRLPDG